MKLNTSFKAFHQPSLTQKLFNSKYLSTAYNNINAPVFGPLCTRYYNEDIGCELDYGHDSSWDRERLRFREDYYAKRRAVCDVDMLTRAEYAEVTGISPTEQIYLEQGFEKFYTHFDLDMPDTCMPTDYVADTDIIDIPCDLLKPEEAKVAYHYLF